MEREPINRKASPSLREEVWIDMLFDEREWFDFGNLAKICTLLQEDESTPTMAITAAYVCASATKLLVLVDASQ